MAQQKYADSTPNVVLQNPTVRYVLGVILGVAMIVLPILGIIQEETILDFSAWLPAATKIAMFLAGLFGLAVTTPNIPKVGRYSA